MLGAQLAGGFYAPVNARGPVAKQRLVLQQFKPDIVVGRSDIFNKTVAGLDALPPLLDVADFPKLPFRDGGRRTSLPM